MNPRTSNPRTLIGIAAAALLAAIVGWVVYASRDSGRAPTAAPPPPPSAAPAEPQMLPRPAPETSRGDLAPPRTGPPPESDSNRTR